MHRGQQFAPRDQVRAARVGALLTMVAAIIGGLFALIAPPPGGLVVQVAALLLPVALISVSILLRRGVVNLPRYFWVALPIAGVAALAALDLATHDASAAGQVFFCYPVLYAAAQLRWLGAAATAFAAVVADALVVFFVLPFPAAATDFCFVTATLVTMTVVLVLSVEAQERLVEALREQAAIDPLTGLVTRRVLDGAINSTVEAGAPNAGTALILIDVDHFKAINDTYGHPVGDSVLVHLAAILVANSRSDSVTCRMGGDELAILLPGCSAEVAVRRAWHFLDAMRSTPLELLDGTLLAISVSIGVAQTPTHAEGIRELYAAADAALYNAKNQGRGTVGVAEPGSTLRVSK